MKCSRFVWLETNHLKPKFENLIVLFKAILFAKVHIHMAY
jgi:hypothetical protein